MQNVVGQGLLRPLVGVLLQSESYDAELKNRQLLKITLNHKTNTNTTYYLASFLLIGTVEGARWVMEVLKA